MNNLPQNREKTGRNEDGTFKGGVSGNPGGRPRNSMKGYVANKLANMTDKEKEQWLKKHRIEGELQWRMGEGNPAKDIDITTKGDKITFIPSELMEKHNLNETDTTTEPNSER